MSSAEEQFIIGPLGFMEAHTERLGDQATRIYAQLYKELPELEYFRNESNRKLLDVKKNDTPENIYSEKLTSLTYSTFIACWQALYALERLDMLAIWIDTPTGGESLISHYVEHYFSDYLARVKLTTDIVALLLNYYFGLGLREEQCSLHKGLIAKRIIDSYEQHKDAKDSYKQINKMYRALESARTTWVTDIYTMRNMVNHRLEFRVAMRIKYNDPKLPSHPLPIWSVREPQFIKLARKLSPRSIVLDDFVDCTMFCEDIWQNLSKLVNSVSIGCRNEIPQFLLREYNIG